VTRLEWLTGRYEGNVFGVGHKQHKAYGVAHVWFGYNLVVAPWMQDLKVELLLEDYEGYLAVMIADPDVEVDIETGVPL
jgi:hypothetical protein